MSNVSVSIASRLILAAGGVLALSVVVLVARPRFSRSSVQLFGASCPCPTFHEQVTGFIVLNPLRDRAPEKLARQFLSELTSGKCNADERIVPELCKAALQRRPVLDLRLKNRKDAGDKVVLFYMFKGKFLPDRGYTYPKDVWGEGMVQVQRIGTEWRVTNYGSRY